MGVQCTDAEWKIMQVLWEEAPCTMAQITHALQPSTGWTRHTVITLLKRMNEKGSVSVDETGNVKRYLPRVSREEASTEQTQKLLHRVFGGKAGLLIANLVDSGEMTMEEMQEVLQMLRDNRQEGGK